MKWAYNTIIPWLYYFFWMIVHNHLIVNHFTYFFLEFIHIRPRGMKPFKWWRKRQKWRKDKIGGYLGAHLEIFLQGSRILSHSLRRPSPWLVYHFSRSRDGKYVENFWCGKVDQIIGSHLDATMEEVT
jgi:hypothetical protein